MRRALVIGIDGYETNPLHGCINDATAVAEYLERNGDGSPNFDVLRAIDGEYEVTSEALHVAVENLFKADAETVLLYFAGHGLINPETNNGYLVSIDGRRGGWGVSLGDILTLANNAHPRIKSTVIILDSCHSGYAGEVQTINNAAIAAIGTGVTILTASHRDGTAQEANGRGVFTDILLDGLAGGCSDVLGNITPAALYSHVDQTLGSWEQRPVYKANVNTFVKLRQVSPKVSLDILRRLPKYFPKASDQFLLDPSFEPDRQNVPEELKGFPVDEEKSKIFKELQICNRHGLIVPVGTDHMYYAAIESKACRLTAVGAHYRKLAELKRI